MSLALARAFADDPIFGYCFPDAGRLNARVEEIAGPDLDRVVTVTSLMEEHYPQQTCATCGSSALSPPCRVAATARP